MREANISTSTVKPHRIRRRNICNESSCVPGAISEKQVEGSKLLNVNREASQGPANEHLQQKFLTGTAKEHLQRKFLVQSAKSKLRGANFSTSTVKKPQDVTKEQLQRKFHMQLHQAVPQRNLNLLSCKRCQHWHWRLLG